VTHQEFIDNYLKNKQYHIKDGILYVDGSLDLQRTEIRELPEGLSIDGSLDLQGSKITELPEGLSIGGWLDLRDSKIRELPEGLSVGGEIYSDKKLSMTDRTQINLIQQNKSHFDIIKNPTEKAVALNKLLWRI